MPDCVKTIDDKLDKLIALTGNASSLSLASPIDTSTATDGRPIETDLLKALISTSFTTLNRSIMQDNSAFRASIKGIDEDIERALRHDFATKTLKGLYEQKLIFTRSRRLRSRLGRRGRGIGWPRRFSRCSRRVSKLLDYAERLVLSYGHEEWI